MNKHPATTPKTHALTKVNRNWNVRRMRVVYKRRLLLLNADLVISATGEVSILTALASRPLGLTLQWPIHHIPFLRSARLLPTQGTLLLKTSTLTVPPRFSRWPIISSVAFAATLVAATARISSPLRGVPNAPPADSHRGLVI